jgi:CRISPR-associated protein Csx10
VQAKDAPQQRCPRCGERMKVMSRFISLQSVRAEYEPPLCHEMHIRIDPERGRVTRGDLFTYVSVEAGQFYVGELVARHADDLRRFRALTGLEEGKTFTLHLGRANRRGYGRVTAWLQPLEPDYEKAPLTWVQLPLSQRVPNADDLITLTLLTDTIISDTWGRCAAGLGGWLSERLRLPVQVAETFVKVRTVDGFNAHLGLPRWRDLALAAGSVAYVRREGDWPEDWQARLAHAEQRSIGLRRNEGFGQIAFNHPLYQPDRTIRDSAIDLPRELHLERGQDELFREKWSRRLDRHTDRLAQLCRSAPFAAVARWLHANQGRTPATLKAWLATLGEPSSVLVEAIGEGEYGDRAKPNRLIEERPRLQPGDLASKEREKEGLGLIYTLLGQLEAEGSANWPTGITMLADRVAGVVVGKGEET